MGVGSLGTGGESDCGCTGCNVTGKPSVQDRDPGSLPRTDPTMFKEPCPKKDKSMLGSRDHRLIVNGLNVVPRLIQSGKSYRAARREGRRTVPMTMCVGR